ncbi:MAG: hypothetical protein ACJ71Z_11285 [Aeromicrobium sp.]
MTQPKFPWALLVILAMFTFVAVTARPPWIIGFAIIAILTAAAAAIYQVIPRKDPALGDGSDVVDPWGDPDKP